MISRNVKLFALAGCVVSVIAIMSAHLYQRSEKAYLWAPRPKQVDNIYKLADLFAECSGYFGMMTWYVEKHGYPESAQTLENTSRGWNMAAAYMLFSSQVVPQWKDAIAYMDNEAELKTQRFKSKVELNERQVMDELKAMHDGKCLPAAELQKSLMTELKRLLVTLPEVTPEKEVYDD